jgi:hypothetical protein
MTEDLLVLLSSLPVRDQERLIVHLSTQISASRASASSTTRSGGIAEAAAAALEVRIDVNDDDLLATASDRHFQARQYQALTLDLVLPEGPTTAGGLTPREEAAARMIRQMSCKTTGAQCGVCLDVLDSGPGAIRLICGDPIHHHCLMPYIQTCLGDR